MWLNILGWPATAFFASSYFFKKAGALRGIQAAAALLWNAYGLAIHSAPVVVSNLMVGMAAVYTSLRLARNRNSATTEGLAGNTR
ncbi:MAG TPA: hypothetical protein VLA83_20670 [Candidatus Binatia bacterium]|nr:hypothetical protein [Candidatus Binatia bacterium]